LAREWSPGINDGWRYLPDAFAQPKGLQGRDDPDNKPSYAFGGSVNTLAMGNPVALLYGEREIGGAIISAGIVAEDI
jgi:predicted phage tail protein